MSKANCLSTYKRLELLRKLLSTGHAHILDQNRDDAFAKLESRFNFNANKVFGILELACAVLILRS